MESPKLHIAGWGSDADPKNDPTYPMRQTPKPGTDAIQRQTVDRPSAQPVNIEVLRSNEHRRMPAVFGTTAPPRGLSGWIRRRAYQSSESNYSHWIPLIVADRVDELEGVWEDLREGRVPNVFAERGWGAEWQHNRKQLVGRVAVMGLIAATAIGCYLTCRHRSQASARAR